MKSIVVAEDDPLYRSLLQRVLELRGFRVRTASDGDEALRLVTEDAPDLVISDLIMPGREGIELLLNLRAAHRAVKTLIISGGGRIDSRDYLHMASQLGASLTLAKPFTDEELMESVNRLLSTDPAAA